MKKAKKTRTTRRKAAPVLEAEPQPVLQIDPVPEPEQKYELEVVDTPPEDGKPTIQPIAATALDLSYMCYGNTAMTAVPVDAIPSGLTALKMKGAFQGCTGLKSIPDTIKDKFKNSANCSLENMFQDCTGITGAVPELWTTLQSTKHTDCFKGCTNASNWKNIPEDWGGPIAPRFILKIFIASSVETKDLDITGFITGNYKINWGDGTADVQNGITHTYSQDGTYSVTITALGDIQLHRMDKMTSFAKYNNLLKFVTEIDVSEVNPIVAIEPYCFNDYVNLTTIPANLFSGLKVTGTSLDLSQCFGWTALTSVPESLLSNLPSSITTLNLTDMFVGCKALANVGATFFNKLPAKLQTLNLSGMFAETLVGKNNGNTLPNYFTALPQSLQTLITSEMFDNSGTVTLSESFFATLPSSLTTLTMNSMFVGMSVNQNIDHIFDALPKTLKSLDIHDTFSFVGYFVGQTTSIIKSFPTLFSKLPPNLEYLDIRTVDSTCRVPAGTNTQFWSLSWLPQNKLRTLKMGFTETNLWDLTSLPDTPFANIPKTVTNIDMYALFRDSKLQTCPPNCFKFLQDLRSANSTEITANLYSFFADSTLNVAPNITTLTQIPNSSLVDVRYMFARCTSITQALPEVWKYLGKTVHDYFYLACTKAANYDDIPSGWK